MLDYQAQTDLFTPGPTTIWPTGSNRPAQGYSSGLHLRRLLDSCRPAVYEACYAYMQI